MGAKSYLLKKTHFQKGLVLQEGKQEQEVLKAVFLSGNGRKSSKNISFSKKPKSLTISSFYILQKFQFLLGPLFKSLSFVKRGVGVRRIVLESLDTTDYMNGEQSPG